MKETPVAMNEMVFTKNKNTKLVTRGISTCIAFVISGYY